MFIILRKKKSQARDFVICKNRTGPRPSYYAIFGISISSYSVNLFLVFLKQNSKHGMKPISAKIE